VSTSSMLLMLSRRAGERIFIPMNIWECVYKWVCCCCRLLAAAHHALLLTAAHVVVNMWKCLSCTLHEGYWLRPHHSCE
jgi:hypothetical protein